MNIIQLLFFTLGVSLSSCDTLKPEEHYLDCSFESGLVVIFFNSDSDRSPEPPFIFNIPESGICFSEYPLNEGYFSENDFQVFLNCKKRKPEKLDYYKFSNEIPDSYEKVACCRETGKITNYDGQIVYYTSYIVGNAEQIKDISANRNTLMDTILDTHLSENSNNTE